MILCIIGFTACVIGAFTETIDLHIAIILGITNAIVGWIAACNIDDLERGRNDR